ncbi:hypothetical protein GmHk_10G028287 [Glycine max]|nr:hypothetical protein GmHk_10G028287 [Glycine max]
MWDATVFWVFNDNFPLYIKHEDLFEIAHDDQCLNISVIQLWILHMTETSMQARNVDVYGFLKPRSIQRSEQSQFESESYIKNWMQNSKRDVYLGAYLNGAHWQMVVILPKENVVIWFCSLHNRPDNYLKGIINSALKGFDDTPQSKFEAAAKWIVVKYFNDGKPLEPERLKALCIQWTTYYLKSDLTSKWALAQGKEEDDDIMAHEVEDDSHQKSGEMTSEVASEIADRIGNFVTHGRQDVLTAAIGRPKHSGHVHATRVGTQTASATYVSIKGSCVNPSEQDPDTSKSDKYGLYVDNNPPHLVALRRVYEGLTIVHNVPLGNDRVKVSIEEVRDADACILVPTQKMTLMILELFLKPMQVSLDSTVFGVYNDNVLLYIKHEDLSEIAHSDQCLNISIIQIWILHMNELSLRSENSSVYDSLSHSPYRDLGNRNLNLMIILRNGCRIHREMSTLEPT